MTVCIVYFLKEIYVADEKGNASYGFGVGKYLHIILVIVIIEAHTVFKLGKLIVLGIVKERFRFKCDAADECCQRKALCIRLNIELAVIIQLVYSLICADELSLAVGDRHYQYGFCNISCFLINI